MATKMRERDIELLEKHLPGLLRALDTPAFKIHAEESLKHLEKLLIIMVRLRQGDWKIIEDFEAHLREYLNTLEFREAVMAVWGVPPLAG